MNSKQEKIVLSLVRREREREDISYSNGFASNFSSMSRLTLVHGDETRIEWNPPIRSAGGLESLLEIVQ